MASSETDVAQPAVGDESTGRLARATAGMAVATFFSRLTGFGRVVALAYALGFTRFTDSYNLANTTPNIIYDLVLGGILASFIVPVFVEHLTTRDEDEAWEAISVVVTTALLLLVGITLLFVIIAVFVINFGPGSRGCTPGGGGSTYAAKVAGSTLTEQDFRFAYIALGGSQVSSSQARDRRLKEFVMDKLIERELLAQEAERLGFDVGAKEVEDMIADGRMMVMGVPRRVDSYVYKDGKFDYERFKMVSQNQLGVSVKHLIEIEQRELMADKVREALRVSAKVSPDEVKQEFEQISKDCRDCLDVQTDEFTQPVSDRISRPTQIVNVYAIQRGTDPEQARQHSAASINSGVRPTNTSAGTGPAATIWRARAAWDSL